MLSNNFAYPQLMRFFCEISDIPRSSYKEDKIADYLCEFARTRGLEYYCDSVNNVLINAPATKGCENRPALLLQGHTDMVCEKNDGVEHDFDTEGLELYEEDGWIRARGTTLGADNGVAVAVMLCVLDGGVASHGPLQCLFTASEEVGLDGVKSFDYSRIYARRMINMDSADESVLIAGCAGGLRSSVTFDVKPQTVTAPYVVAIKLKGLFGGHSGEDIDKGRANANKLMGRVLEGIFADYSAHLVSIYGGTKDNAIPRECEAVIAVDDIDALNDKVSVLQTSLQEGIAKDDRNMSLELSIIGENTDVSVMDSQTAEKIIFLMRVVDNGIFEMNNDILGLVEWSRNLGIVKCDINGAELVFSSRSSYESRLDTSAAELDTYARLLDAKVRHYNRYPGWNYAKKSEIREAYISAFKELFGKAPEVTVIHAGLECGFISQAVPDMDIVSCGAVVRDLHSPDERLEKASFERFYSVIKRVLEN